MVCSQSKIRSPTPHLVRRALLKDPPPPPVPVVLSVNLTSNMVLRYVISLFEWIVDACKYRNIKTELLFTVIGLRPAYEMQERA
jgi:hypothetical protein